MAEGEAPRGVTRRESLGLAAMVTGLVLAYGTLAAQAVLFLVPRRVGPRTRKLFVGRVEHFEMGGVRTLHDLEGSAVLVKRTAEGFTAFGSVCPHLGCRVHWEQDKGRFFCPCHNGVFDPDGVATAGPPAAAGQVLPRVPLEVDETRGVVFLEVAAPRRKGPA